MKDLLLFVLIKNVFLLWVWSSNNNYKRGGGVYYVNGLVSQSTTTRTSRRTTTISTTTALRVSTIPTTTTTKSNSEISKANNNKKKKWFPTRIQEDVDYTNLVSSFYLRHIVVETKEIAQLAMEQYLNMYTTTTTTTESESIEEESSSTSSSSSNLSQDPFGDLAKKISACPLSREEGGKIGWIDLVDIVDNGSNNNNNHDIIPMDVLNQLCTLTPKSGDVHIIQSKSTKQFHLVRVEELLIRHNPTIDLDETKEVRVGSHTGYNAVLPRRKLKGTGIMPKFPTILRENDIDDTENNDDDNNNSQRRSHKSYFIKTNGCQMNVADSERLAGILQNDIGLQPAKQSQDADVVLFNTCSIRDHAEQKLYDILGPYCARKRQGEELALIVTGCVAQQEGEALLRRVPEVDVVLGPQYVPFLRNVLESVQWGHQVVVTAPMLHSEQQDNDFFSNKPVRGHTVRAWVNIINGCNEHCTYCVVPATRGMEQSRNMESILRECQSLLDDGYKEITLLGQNIDAYGRDMVPKRTFAELLEYLNYNLKDHKCRIRYVTSHPRYFSDRVIDAVADLDKVCECFHMPFQAGDDDVLKRMRRGYTYDSYMKIITRIRSKSPDAAICGDVIVGFPGESEEAFQKTLKLMEEVKFDNLNTFAYSPRPNTEAATWEDQIPEDVKSRRLQQVQELATKHGLERSQRYLSREVEVLVEDKNPRNPNQVMGRTRQGRQVYFDGDIDTLKGEFVNVQITEARTWSLMGKLIE